MYLQGIWLPANKVENSVKQTENQRAFVCKGNEDANVADEKSERGFAVNRGKEFTG